ncbi:hypothetical protein RchiOBHm_Chr5g0048011 [Rosa chinensis]|uniref:Uncharacterized protein n=1 Tax=Rosa chinensis TaxID=74649 RepID=A0A2P6QEI3_ROSCH|nr:hypothetical protein RchiOBHm_Chr5g0048011 [Rosa chinensis]
MLHSLLRLSYSIFHDSFKIEDANLNFGLRFTCKVAAAFHDMGRLVVDSGFFFICFEGRLHRTMHLQAQIWLF